MIGKKKVEFLIVISLAFALVMANTSWVFAASPVQNDLAPSVEAAAWGWTTVVSEYMGTGDSDTASVAVGPDGTVHFAWDDETDWHGSGSDSDIWYVKQTPPNTWTFPEVVSKESTDGSFDPSLDVGPDGTVHIAWWDETDYGGSGTDADIFYKKFVPDVGWTSTEVVSKTSAATSVCPSLGVTDSGTVHVVWQDDDPSLGGADTDIWHSWNIPGSGWMSIALISLSSTGSSFSPSLDIGPGGTMHVVWEDYTDLGSGADRDIFYRGDLGPVEVISTASTGQSYQPSLAVGSDGKVHIAWYDSTDYAGSGTDSDIFYKRFVPGTGWMTTEVVSKESTDGSFGPSLDVGPDGTVHIAWYDYTDYGGSGTDLDIFYNHLEPGEGMFYPGSTKVVSTDSTEHSLAPSLAVGSDGTVNIAWEDWTDYAGCGADSDIFYKKFGVLVADAGGPYITSEGTHVTLDASGSHYALGFILTYEWDLDNDGEYDDATGETTTFTTVGQDGVYPIALNVTATDGTWTVDQTEVAVFNSSPTVALSSDAPKDALATVTVTGTVMDKGWLDPLTATIDWADGSPPEPISGTLENVEPDATLSFTVSHVYSEAGVYTATVAASDDDITKYVTINLQINPLPEFQYHFRLKPYVDVFHMNLTKCGWITGIVTTPDYAVPLIGKYENGRAYIAFDLPEGGVEMGFLVITTSSMTGYMGRIRDDQSLIGLDPVWFAAATTAGAGPMLDDDVAGILVAPMALHEFVMNPYDDLVYLDTEFGPWLWGWAEAVGDGYPAPILGFYEAGRFFYAMDYVDGEGLYELLFAAGSTSTLTGAVVRSPGGFIYEDPTHIWLTTP